MSFFEQIQQMVDSYTEIHSSVSSYTYFSSNEGQDKSAQHFVFEEGIPGFRGYSTFMLKAHPDLQGGFFLKSLERPEITFLTLPLDPQKGPVDKEDLIGASSALKSRFEDCAFFVLISIKPKEESNENEDPLITVNLKAPLVMDLVNRRGKQVILGQNYPMAHPLSC